MAYEIAVSWHVQRAAEGLGGLRAGRTKLFLPFPSQWALDPRGLWFCWACQAAGKIGSDPHTLQGRSQLLPASLRLMAFNLEFNQCGFSLESWMLQSGRELYDL